ncbi:substrate-binding domain-containing protein [Streptomyces sp. NBC_01546]|uniref:substrate-binding domain-containing protein n=1 Tax=Streptomyces sp. NBC_01546 TaxID=2975872 RepID=UPI00386C6DE0
MALGLLRALRESGRSISGDISVVGFGDIPEAAHFVPPLAACGRTSASSAAGPGTARRRLGRWRAHPHPPADFARDGAASQRGPRGPPLSRHRRTRS